VWDYCRSRKRPGGDDGSEPVVTASRLERRHLDKFDGPLDPKALRALADKRILAPDPDAGDGCYRLADADAAAAVFREVERGSPS